ncbi:MAG: hypothetical protein CME07_04855 [Gemmatimonadetes bacterium]|nr:hypothetical protein [Gemmatimonadota bacterium]
MSGVTAPARDLRDIPGAGPLSAGGVEVTAIRRELAELLPGEDAEARARRALADFARRPPESMDHGLAEAAGGALEDLVVLDLETAGLWGNPLFLVGLLLVENGRAVTLQLLAPDYAREGAVIRAASALLAERRVLVTFNGKSFDAPFLRERGGFHGVGDVIAAQMNHLDLLHPARRRYRDELPDCRLQTLERHVTGLHRAGDIPGDEIPAVYHEYVRTGDAELLVPVLHHGRLDVVTTLRLLTNLLGE